MPFQAFRRLSSVALITFISLSLTHCGWLGDLGIGKKAQTGSLSGGGGSTSQQTTNTVTVPATTSNPTLAINLSNPLTTGYCTPGNVSARNASGVVVPVSTTIPVGLSYPAGIHVYGQSDCTGGEITQVSILAGQGAVPFYVRADGPGTYSITATAPGSGYDPHTFTFNVSDSPSNVPLFLSVTGAGAPTSGVCTQYNFSLINSSQAPAAFSTVKYLSLVSVGDKGGYYEDAGCLTPSGAIRVNAGTSVGSFYFKGNKVGAATIQGLIDSLLANRPIFVQAGAATRLEVAGPTTINNQECRGYTVTLRDMAGNPVNASVAYDVALTKGSSSEPGSFYLGSTSCGTATSNVGILSGNASAAFSFKSSDWGAVLLKADISSASLSGQLPVTIIHSNPGAPAKIGFVLPGGAPLAGDCFGPVRFQILDLADTVIPNAPAVNLDLTTTGLGKFYSSQSECQSGTPNITTALSSATVWYRDDASELTSVTATDHVVPGLGSASVGFNVGPGSPYSVYLSVSNNVFDLGINQGCVPVSVAIRDRFTNGSVPPSGTVVTLSEMMAGGSTATGTFYQYSSGACGAALPYQASTDNQSLTFGSGDGFQKIVGFRQSRAGGAGVMRGSASGLNPFDLSFSVIAGCASKAEVAGPGSIPSGSCGGYSIALFDAFDNPAAACSNLTFDLLQDVTVGDFQTGNNCGGPLSPVNKITINQGLSTGSFSFRASDPGPRNAVGTLRGDGANGNSIQKAFPLNVVPGPNKFVFLPQGSTPANNGQGLVNEVYPFKLVAQTAVGVELPLTSNVMVQLSPSGNFYLNSTCSGTAVTAPVLFPAGQSRIDVCFQRTVAGAVSLEAQDQANQMVKATHVLNLSPGSVHHLGVTGPAFARAGLCSDPFALKAYDQFNNEVILAAGTISFTGLSAAQVFPTAACASGGSALTLSGASQGASFWMKSTRAESLSPITASYSGKTGMFNFVIIPGAASPVVTPNPLIGYAGFCSASPFTFQLQDGYANSYVPANPVELEGVGGLMFFSDAACANAITSRVVQSNGVSLPVYFRGNIAGSLLPKMKWDAVEATFPVSILTADGPPAIQLYVNGLSTNQTFAVADSTARVTWSSQYAQRCEVRVINNSVTTLLPGWTEAVNAAGRDYRFNNTTTTQQTYLMKLTCYDVVNRPTDSSVTISVPPPYRVVIVPRNTSNKSCAAVCGGAANVATSPEGDQCVSGEQWNTTWRLAGGQLFYGCWQSWQCTSVGNNVWNPVIGAWNEYTGGPTLPKTKSFGDRCYRSSDCNQGTYELNEQNCDGDSTDITVACFCR